MTTIKSDPNFYTRASDWLANINYMHRHYGVKNAVAEFDNKKLQQLLEFRVRFIQEEFNELVKATEDRDREEVVDALIDIMVVALGTLDIFEIDADKAWIQVHHANMAKEVGVKESRPNPLGLPDLVKPEGWTAPSHVGNYGRLPTKED